jgi:hypothetical protein
MAEPIHLESLADFFNRIGPKRRVALRRLSVAFGAYRTLVGTGAEWTCSE